jgi:type I restriction enzyme M protein
LEVFAVPAAGISEAETVIKRVLPYLKRRGYDVDTDLVFELPATDGARQQFIDIGVTLGSGKPKFLIEAKRQSHRILQKDRTQALNYGKSIGVPFVVVTNGVDLELLNTVTGEPLRVTDSHAGRSMIPHKTDVNAVLQRLKTSPNASDLRQKDSSLPFRPGLPLKQLNALFARCHSKIRTIEKDEDNAFADFSKLLFLRLLEEKADEPGATFKLSYSTRFHELAQRPPSSHDEVKTLVDSMIAETRKQYGDVITSGLHIKQPSTYAYLVKALSEVSFIDSGLDTKGAAFEYFVRATLKGKKLGQYFTPRQLVELMLEMVGTDLIVGTLKSGEPMKVLDPACGTGGFLVYLMKHALDDVESGRASKKLTTPAAASLAKRIKEDTFFGIDANHGVASSAKMNMIISGDGHTNIVCANSLDRTAPYWSLDDASFDLIISNPPFGTSESDLPADSLAEYPVQSTKGQLLFLQKMLQATKPGGTVCTVIDEGALNTDTAATVRRWILENSRVRSVVSLPPVTFKPNKITVKSSVLMFERIDPETMDPDADYPIRFVTLETLGFLPSGELIRGFDTGALKDEFREAVNGAEAGAEGGFTRSFDVPSHDVLSDQNTRLDFKYWDPVVRAEIEAMRSNGGRTLESLNKIPIDRGISPKATAYVDAADGFAMVLKAGSSVTTFGEVVDSGDWIEKDIYDVVGDRAKVQRGDVLLSSTGDGTLGKAAVYDLDLPAVADGHITILRVDPDEMDPWFLADYLREGFGRVQTNRLFTGSTGLIELTAESVKTIIVPPLTLAEQQEASKNLRTAEAGAVFQRRSADDALAAARVNFAGFRVDEDGEVKPLPA